MKKLTLGCLLAACATLALAQPPSADSVETLLTVTKAQDLVDRTSAQMEAHIRQGMQAAVPTAQLSPAQRQLLDSLPKRLAAALQPDFNWAVMKPDFVRLYMETFTQEEVDAMVAFYRTPAGQAVVDKMPVVMNRAMQLTQARLAGLMPRLVAALNEAKEEFKAAQ